MESRKCYPLLLLFKGDHPECKNFAGLKGGSTHHPCSICGTLHCELHRLPEHEQPVRSQQDVKECVEQLDRLESKSRSLAAMREWGNIDANAYSEQMKSVRAARDEVLQHMSWMSAHNVRCAFWRLGYVDVALMAAIDLMHLADLGLVRRILLHTAAFYYCRHGSKGLKELNEWWREMEFPEDVCRARQGDVFKIGKTGHVEVCSSLKANEYKAILQLFPPLVRSEVRVHAVWVALHHWYEVAHNKSFSEEGLEELTQAALECVSQPARSYCCQWLACWAHWRASGVQVAGSAGEIAAA